MDDATAAPLPVPAGPYDAVLVLSFGGPDGPDDVVPFLENVTRGRGIPRERLVEVGAHYDLFGGVSPINAANRALIAALRADLAERGPDLPVYWGNRNWHPLLADTLAAMAADGIRRAVCFVTSAYSSYSSCRQYRDDVARARAEVPGAPEVDVLRPFFDHPGFIGPMAANARAALDRLDADVRHAARLVFTAHSIPLAQAMTCDYEVQLREASRLVAERVDPALGWDLVFQSRSGPPSQPWLGPDVGDHLGTLHAAGVRAVVLVPVGFVADHVEVVYDLDIAAAAVAADLGLTVVRAATPGTAPEFVAMVGQLIAERTAGTPQLGLGALPPRPLSCAPGCCPQPARPAPGAGRPAPA